MTGLEMLMGSTYHWSPSSISSAVNEPSEWALRLAGKRTPYGAAAARGICTEAGVVAHLFTGLPIDQAIDEAIAAFDHRMALEADPKIERERAVIPEMVRTACEVLSPYGKPDFPPAEEGQKPGQWKINMDWPCNGEIVPCIGFVDFLYSESGRCIDLKTTLRMPSEMTWAHKLQCSIYQEALPEYKVGFLYVTPKKYEIKTVEAAEQAFILAQAVKLIERFDRLLQLAGDAETLLDIVPIDVDNFRWNSAGAQKIRMDTYGI